MTELQPYPAYKPSGVHWLGDIPSHWEVRKIKHSADLVRELMEAKGSGKRYVGMENVESGTGKVGVGIDSNSIEGLAINAPGGAVIFGKLRPYLAKVGLIREATLTSTEFLALVGTSATPEYLKWLLISPDFIDLVDSSTYGAKMPRASWEFVGNSRISLPPLDEQRAIADYLDRKDAEITRFIDSRRRMIALLEEKKQAIINQAVTKGLDPSVPMKNSGVEWLSEIPAHWEVRRLKWVSLLHRGYDLPATSRNEGTVPVISSGGIVGYHDKAMMEGPGVIMGRYGSTKNLFYSEVDYWPHNTSLYVDDFRASLPRFIYWLLGTINVEAFSAKSAVPGVDRNDLHEIEVAYPPVEEQRSIAEYLNEFEQTTTKTLSRYEREIELMEEYRTRLISDVVTGKVRIG